MRFVTIILLLAASASSAAAQERRHVGAKLGPNFSVVVFDPDEGEEHDRRIAIGGGGFATLPLTRYLAVQIEALFNPRGAKLYDPEQNLTASVLLQYFETPVLLRINGPRRGSGAYHVFAGPYSGIRTGATRQISFVENSITTGEKTDMSREVKRFEFGLTAGAGVDIGRWIVIDGRYSHGLTRLNTCAGSEAGCEGGEDLEARNRALSFMMGVRF